MNFEESANINPMGFTKLEQAIIGWIAARTNDAVIEGQMMACYPVKRELTGVGSFTLLGIPDGTLDVAQASSSRVIPGPWIGETTGLPFGASSLLFFSENGQVELNCSKLL